MKVFLIICLATAISYAQKTEIGGTIAGGAFAVSSGEAALAGQAGAEACVFCSGRFAVFGEYSHWFSGSTSPFSPERVKAADIGGVGLRIQGRSPVRLFFDVGLAAGRDVHVAGRGGAMGGVVIGTGIRIPWGEHWYVRPQFRAYGLSPHTIEGLGLHWAVSGGLGIGYRF